MNAIARMLLVAGLSSALSIAACEEQSGTYGSSTDEHGHDHDGDGHAEGDHDYGDGHAEGDHDDHDLAALGTVAVGDMEVQAFQGHGMATAGKELHLVVKLPDGDSGATVRAWIGTDDRYGSVVARADYSAEQGGYQLHAVAPDPLPENASWWIEVELADGTTHVGSVAVR